MKRAQTLFNLGNQTFSLAAIQIATKRTKESTKIFEQMTFAAHPECQLFCQIEAWVGGEKGFW